MGYPYPPKGAGYPYPPKCSHRLTGTVPHFASCEFFDCSTAESIFPAPYTRLTHHFVPSRHSIAPHYVYRVPCHRATRWADSGQPYSAISRLSIAPDYLYRVPCAVCRATVPPGGPSGSGQEPERLRRHQTPRTPRRAFVSQNTPPPRPARSLYFAFFSSR